MSSTTCYPNTNQAIKVGDTVEYYNTHEGWVNGTIIQTYEIPVFVVKDGKDETVFVECKASKLALPGTNKNSTTKRKKTTSTKKKKKTTSTKKKPNLGALSV